MDSFKDAFSKASGLNGNGETATFVDEVCPILAEALAGEWNDESKRWTRKPYSVTVWIDEGMVKMCLGIDDAHPKWFWSQRGLEAFFEAAEAALKAEKGSWYKVSERKRR